MAENITVVMNKDDLQPLANDIKTLNGLGQSDLVTLNEMEKAVEDANDAIDSQENLIAQISAALEGKAGGGSGGNAVEMCTVTLSNRAWGVDVYYIYTVINPDGTYSAQRTLVGHEEADSASITVTVPKYSTVIIDEGYIYQYALTLEGADFMYWVSETDDPNYSRAAAIMVTADTAFIEFYS